MSTGEFNSKTRFLARMSHEIRTPITAIIGISEIELQNPNIPSHMEESFAKIHTSANALLAIVNDVLDLSKIETGKMELFYEEYDVASLIRDVTGMYPHFSGNKELTFRLKIAKDMPSRLFGDVSRIRQVINNLLSNALKYTDSGKVELNWDWDGKNLAATVRDTGSGISAEQIKTLKNGDYERLHKGDGQFTGGPGLGLSIVYSLLALMDAKIEIISEVGIGTEINVFIPQKTTENSREIGEEVAERLRNVKADAVSKKFPFTLEPMPYGNVLLVDDVEANLFVAKGLLSFYGLKVDSCASGYDAIEKIRAGKKYDLIFMDYMMPGLSGMETMHMLRAMDYNEPIVALTANALIGNAEKFISAGFDGFIPKPINTKQLNDTLTKFIRNKQTPEVLKAAKLSGATGSPLFTGDELLAKLRLDFIRHRKNTIFEINTALSTGDINQAHFLVHTLKGSAALIHETTLANAAEVLEKMLNKDEIPPQDALDELEAEFIRVMERAKQAMSAANTPRAAVDTSNEGNTLSKPKTASALALLDQLEPMLTHRKAQCINAIGELRDIPEATVFVRQIENFDFAAALVTLPVLREILDE
ncbi:MAG: response regulator [Defluviitaleaceae bacterium]|nr:response regulator [Defluviitaleaceae bacterium]